MKLKINPKYRKASQFLFGGIVLYVIFAFNSGLAIILGFSFVFGIIFGKFFCKWMCPLGLFMEFMTRNMSSEQAKAQMYNYYKLGCPISWIQGFLNKYSVFKIKRNESTCLSCGLCDKSCYIAALNANTSNYKTDKLPASTQFNCSKCLECIEVCPNESLTIEIS